MIVDVINKKRLGQELSFKEMLDFFEGYMKGTVTDYQMSSLLMAICINGMTEEETFGLTKIFVDSGEILDFSDIVKVKVDKHSTGGIGDKTTLVVGPIVAACGVPVCKMSGRGLGYTGGTIDKLESIPGYRTDLSEEEIINQVEKIGIVVTGATAELAPLDKKIYALRDVTGTVSSIPLIASSIMSKKIAGGADKILIDIKVGCGALLQTKEEAEELSDLLIKIGRIYQREVRTVISDMNTPLGTAIGNSLEVEEAMDILQGKEISNNLVDLCIDLASHMISMGKGISYDEAKKLALSSINKGTAYKKFLQLVQAQGGDIDSLTHARKTRVIKAHHGGVLESIDALELGKYSVFLGAGRTNKDDVIDYGVGIKLHKLVGERVRKGSVLATIYVNRRAKVPNINKIFVIR